MTVDTAEDLALDHALVIALRDRPPLVHDVAQLWTHVSTGLSARRAEGGVGKG